MRVSLSIIIPVYNVAQFLRDCLESIVKQGLDNYEVILIDDGSNDGSSDICDWYVSHYSQFHVIHQNNAGVSEARNKGILEAKGEYVLFLDGDDFLIPGSIPPLLNIAFQNNLDLLGFKHIFVPENGMFEQDISLNAQSNLNILSGKDYIAQYNFTIQIWWYLVRRDIIVYNKIFFPAGHMLEDAAYNMRLFLKCDRMAQVQNVAYCYRMRSNSIMHKNDNEHMTCLLDDYIYAAEIINDTIKKHLSDLNDEALKRCLTRRDSYIFFGAIRACKIGRSADFIKLAKSKGLYPFPNLNETDYPGLKYKLLHWCIVKPWLMKLIGRIYNLKII